MRKIIAAALLVFLGGCGGPKTLSPEELAKKLPLTQESAHYTFHYSSGAEVDPARQEVFHDWAIAQLGVVLGHRIDYYRYLDRAQMKSITGRDTNGWADPDTFAVHSVWPWENHEVVHVFTDQIGTPSHFFNEGIAVALSVDPFDGILVPYWQGKPVHDYARSLLQQNRIPPLSGIVDSDGFREFPSLDSYAIAGSFVEFLIDRYGIDKCKQFFAASSRGDSRTVIALTFQRVYGQALTEAEQEWLTFLRQ